jgi:hypothetical protein
MITLINKEFYMKIPFKWEEITSVRCDRVSEVTLRAKVIGGWLVKNVYVDENSLIREHTVNFITDIAHEWEIEQS